MSPLVSHLQLGRVPRVVGTIITSQFLEGPTSPLPCDLVELRVDGYPDYPGWLDSGRAIEKAGIPTFATIRLSKEGGKWTRPDSDRGPLLEQALTHLAGVDVEIESELAEPIARRAQELQKLCVLSHHDFQTTPALERMRSLLREAHEMGAIGKLAVTVHTPADLENLQTLLAEKWPLPICLIGMGPMGRQTRLTFPLQGSCFTYGYLDTPGAPGQFSAAELQHHLSSAKR